MDNVQFKVTVPRSVVSTFEALSDHFASALGLDLDRGQAFRLLVRHYHHLLKNGVITQLDIVEAQRPAAATSKGKKS